MKYKDFSNRIRSDSMTVVDSGVIQDHIIRLLGTNKGEMLDNPEYGSNLRSFLYQSMSSETEAFIQMEVERSISIWEPRAIVQDVQVDFFDTHKLTVAISCYIPEFDTHISFASEVRKG